MFVPTHAAYVFLRHLTYRISVSLLRYYVLICKSMILPQAPRLLTGCCLCSLSLHQQRAPSSPFAPPQYFYGVKSDTLSMLFLAIIYKTISFMSFFYKLNLDFEYKYIHTHTHINKNVFAIQVSNSDECSNRSDQFIMLFDSPACESFVRDSDFTSCAVCMLLIIDCKKLLIH